MTWHGSDGPASGRCQKVPICQDHADTSVPTCNAVAVACIHIGPSNYPTEKKRVKHIPNTMDKLEIPRGGARATPITNPPRLAPQPHPLSSSSTTPPTRTSASPIPIIYRSQSSPPLPTTERDDTPISFQDLMPHLHRSAPSIVKTRSGSVLSRGFILKTDYYPSGGWVIQQRVLSRLTDAHIGRALDLDLNVHGAPNFRAPRTGSLNVFGAAQPRSQGLRAILSILRARQTETSPSHVIWFSTREEPIGMPR
jgi:hypothetical protein